MEVSLVFRGPAQEGCFNVWDWICWLALSCGDPSPPPLFKDHISVEIESRSRPGPDRVLPESIPGPDQVQPGSRPGPDRVKQREKPGGSAAVDGCRSDQIRLVLIKGLTISLYISLCSSLVGCWLNAHSPVQPSLMQDAKQAVMEAVMEASGP